MSAEEVGNLTGDVGINMLVGAYSFRAIGLISKGASGIVLENVNELKNTLNAERMPANAAGVGKISLEEGIDAANIAIEIVEKS